MFKLLLLVATMSGCSSYNGNWTAKVGSYISTFQINGDTGFFCYSKGSLTKIDKIDFSGSVITSKKGSTEISAIQYARDGVRGEIDNFVLEGDIFYRDNDLHMASAYCRKVLR